jgi:hypothetical protein
MSATRDTLLTVLTAAYGFALEVPFRGLSGKRRFRWDAADEARKIAVEYQGVGAGHQWAKEQAKDHEKLNEAILCGWQVIQCSAESVNNGVCLAYIDAAIAVREKGDE